MNDTQSIRQWPEIIRQRYENYLKTSFFFKEPALRASFQSALQKEGMLLKGPFPEPARGFKTGMTARALAEECFPGRSIDLIPALIDRELYKHQDSAVRTAHLQQQNVVVATGTASGKTESFLYPILFELYRQYIAGELQEPGVRAMILYPMNALANDQRERLGEICRNLTEAGSGFTPTFGQYIGQTPKNTRDRYRHAAARDEERLPGELIFREEMRSTPPHILLTNYSMLEYLLIRPDDSPLFDGNRGIRWKFIVLDEAHQYRGARGMEMGMLIRRLKQRLRVGGRTAPFRCIATSATLSTGQETEDREAVSAFATELFGEQFSKHGVIFGESQPPKNNESPRRYHAFLRALEGAFLVHSGGCDTVVLNRRGSSEDESSTTSPPEFTSGTRNAAGVPLELALCRECGQHYYVGRTRRGKLQEAVRDPSQSDFGVEYYLPLDSEAAGTHVLCRRCGALSASDLGCDCGAALRVKKCESHKDRPDQLDRCETCGYQRGGIGDPVQEIVHGSDGPNAVIATALHELLPDDRRKVLAFADSRQEAAFFAWYAQDSYQDLRDRNLLHRALIAGSVAREGLSIDDLGNRLLKQWDHAGLFGEADTAESRKRRVQESILREALTDERRLSLSGVGLVTWTVKIPDDVHLPETMRTRPWNLTDAEARSLLRFLLDELRVRRAMGLPDNASAPRWDAVCLWPQQACCKEAPRRRSNVFQWGGRQSAVVIHFLRRMMAGTGLSAAEVNDASVALMQEIWRSLRDRDRRHNDADHMLSSGRANGTFRLNSLWLRIKPARTNEVWECDTCATVTSHNVRGICPRNRCPGNLRPADHQRLAENHYRFLYEKANLPSALSAEEHTAQIDSDEARQRQHRFKNGRTHLLSSSTTFEIGVDLGDLDAVFLRNVPPEPFNYTQRVGRAGRRESPGLAVTYCRRNPHDLYHYEDPETRVINGKVHPPRLQLTNRKIIIRHMAATVLSAFFREHPTRFRNVAAFLEDDWSNVHAVAELSSFAASNCALRDSLRQIVPDRVHEAIGLDGDAWIDEVMGPNSRLASAEDEVCADYRNMMLYRAELFKQNKGTNRVEARLRTIAREPTLNFLSRKAVIPKYGFPVDVVELDTRPTDGSPTGVLLQRDLSQAIAEYAPGGKVVANKLEWESCGIKKVPAKEWPVRKYRYDDARSFRQWDEGDSSAPQDALVYLSPIFGFVTPLFTKPKEPRRRSQRLYTTRPFFRGFEQPDPETQDLRGVSVTRALPGTLIILCEGRNRKGFFICQSCGTHMTQPKAAHKSPSNTSCSGSLRRFSLGHELITDVVRLQFPSLTDEWDTYSVAYAVLLGAAETLDVPDTDLNVTVAGGSVPGSSAIVLYDNVPGGAGLVAQLEQERVFEEMLGHAHKRVRGACRCDTSCYGCLRSYRNQFAHPHLDRRRALKVLYTRV